MIKHILFFLSITLFFSGCVERGQEIQPAPVQHRLKKAQHTSGKAKEVQQAIPKVAEIAPDEISVDDTTQNTIAGVLVLIIGIMVFI